MGGQNAVQQNPTGGHRNAHQASQHTNAKIIHIFCLLVAEAVAQRQQDDVAQQSQHGHLKQGRHGDLHRHRTPEQLCGRQSCHAQQLRQHHTTQSDEVFAAHDLLFCHRQGGAVSAEPAVLVVRQQCHGQDAQHKPAVQHKEIRAILHEKRSHQYHSHRHQNDPSGVAPHLIGILQ